MALTKTTAWSLGTVGLCAALTAGSWFILIEPEQALAAEARAETVAAESSNAELEARIDQLRAEYADLPNKQAELAAIRQALPDEPALAQLIRDISSLADGAGVTVDSVTTGAVVAVIDPDAGDRGRAPAEADAAAGAEPSTEPTPEPSGAAPAGAPAAPAVPGAPAGAVLASIPVTVEVTGGFFETNLLLKGIQADLTRALLVDGLTITVVEQEEIEPGTVKTSVTARVFVFVDPDSVDALTPVPAATN
jgi:type IV pilus assembly protein PilO